jgi:hypothetical protein
MAIGVEVEAIAALADVEAELRVEAFGDVEIRHAEREAIQRMHRGHAIAA